MATEGPTGKDVVRASDAERERVVSLLREHAGEGRLDIEELAARLDRAYSARTRDDLARLTDDLPDPPPRSPRKGDGRRRELVDLIAPFVTVNLLLVVIWALTGAGYFWPMWPILGWGVGVVSHGSKTLFGVRLPFVGPCGHRRSAHRASA
jgi:hypothetical protein